MGIKDTLRKEYLRIRTAVHFHRARRRTRQVFRRKPNMSMIVAIMLIALMVLVVYFFAINPWSKGNSELADEGSFVDEDTNVPTFVEENGEVFMDVETEPSPEVAPSRSWPIDIVIPSNLVMTNVYGDSSQDALLPGDCSMPIRDAKRDIEREFRYNVEAQEEFALLEVQYEQAQKSVKAAYNDLVAKRRKLDAIRISCIEEKEPFGEPFNEFLDVTTNN